MKKYTRLLIVFALVFVMVASLLTACQVHEHTFSNDWSNDTQYHWHAATCEHSDEVSQKGAHEDLNNDGACDICAYASCTHTYADEWSSNKLNHWKEATCGHNVKGSEAAHADGDGDGLCDTCFYECGDHDHTFEDKWSYDGDFHWHNATCIHDYAVKSKGAHTGMSDFICDVCGYVSHVHTAETDWTFDMDGHWHKATCEHEDAKIDYAEHFDEVVDGKCDVCLMTLMESVSYTLNISDLTAGTLAADEISGMFTIVSGSEIRNRTKTFEGVEYNKSVKIGNSATQIKVSVPGAGKLYFLVQNGSSGASTQFITVTAPDGTVHDIEFPGTNEGSPVVKIELEVTEGEWVISRGKNGGTQDIFFLELACVVEVSPENGFKLVAEGKVDYLVGEKFDSSRIQLNSTFANGKIDVLDVESVTIDSSKVDMTKAGVYEVTISYKEYTPITYEVSVYAPDAIELGFDAIEKIANSAAGNGVYFNHSFREVYGIGDELDTAGLSVKVIAKCGEKTLAFTVSDYEITGFDSATAGTKVLTIATNGLTTNVNVDVVDTAIAEGNQVKVDKAYTGTPGAIEDGYNMFTTIQQALDFLAKVEPSEAKLLVIGEGLFTEKLEITIPNLTIRGAGKDKTIIEWDSLYGLIDAGGFTHTTDSTQTVAVREQAVNCVIEDLTISNYWNTQERMDEANLAIERGLALLVQADRFIMRDSALLGIQDTLELFTGRQYFENVFISGYTDFIFGTNNTTYFKNCVVHVIDTGKDDAGTAGYLTAFKGSNKGAADSIVYGAIFDGCKFTADEGVTLGKTAIGRTWGAYAAVAVINSDIGGHISVDGYDSANNKNKRYISMNGIHPTDATVQFVEFNNTGAGAIAEAVAGMKMLTADEAAKYADFATIYGTINGNVSYLDPWDPTSSEVVVDDRDYYYFTGASSTTGISHTFDTTTTIAKGSTLEWDGLLISAENGNVAWNQNANALNMKAGAFIKFTVPAGSIVTVETYPNYNYFTLNGVGTASANMLSQYYAEQTEVTLLSTGDLYLYSIIINPDEQAPQAPTFKELIVDGMKVDYLVGEEISLEGISVKVCYSDNSVLPVEYTVDTSAVDTSAAGEYVVVFNAGENKVEVKVTFIADLTISESTTIDLSATGANIQKTTGTYKSLAIDATNGKFADNGSGWVQVNTGTIISFEYEGEAKVSVTAYTSADSFDIVIANGICTITAVANDYLKAISITIVKVYSESTTIDLSATGAKIEGSVGAYEGLNVDATAGKFADNGSGWVQVNAGTIITLNVAEGAEVSVTPYSSAENFEIAIVDGVCTITVKANDYLKAITVICPVVYDQNTTIDLSATGANIQGSTGVYEGLNVDATAGKFADNNGGWVQVNAGTIITLNVAEGAKVSLTPYKTVENFEIVIADGICTITVKANDYLKAIAIEYPSDAVTYTLTMPADSVTWTEETLINDIFTATNKAKTESIKISGAAYEADGLTFSGKQISLTGGRVQLKDGVFLNGIKVVVEEGKSGHFVMYVAAKDYSNTDKGARTILISILDTEASAVTATNIKKNGTEGAFENLSVTEVEKYEFDLPAGTYYIGGSDGGAYIYGMSVTVE